MANGNDNHPFETYLEVSVEDIEFELSGHGLIPWSDFLLNPRRLRGSDFLMRWSQGAWSEESLVKAVELSERYVAYPYGPSSTAPDNDVRAFELYFERLEEAGLATLKRPDLLIFRKEDEASVVELINRGTRKNQASETRVAGEISTNHFSREGKRLT